MPEVCALLCGLQDRLRPYLDFFFFLRQKDTSLFLDETMKGYDSHELVHFSHGYIAIALQGFLKDAISSSFAACSVMDPLWVFLHFWEPGFVHESMYFETCF